LQIPRVSSLSDAALVTGLDEVLRRDRATTVELLVYLGEVDARKLYLPAGYSSMYSYCVRRLKMSQQTSYKRIRVARSAREFPAILRAIAAGDLHLSALVMLAPHFTPENATQLLQAAASKTESEIEKLLAEYFPRPDLAARIDPIATPQVEKTEQIPEMELSARIVEKFIDTPVATSERPILAPVPVPPSRVSALAPQRFGIQFTFGEAAHDKLGYAQQLLGHQVPPGDLAGIFERALDALIAQLEHRKFAATDRPRQRCHPSNDARHIPSAVKRVVWARDRGRCTFVSESGQRCEARTGLEFDHIEPVARGGRATVENVRLRCRGHNQFEADRTFGAEFMNGKRASGRRTASGV